MSEVENASGWDAIDASLQNIYGDQEPKHYGTIIPYMLGGPDPLNGISVYEVKKPVAHWHFVTYGFSELYDKESSDLEYSGYGFELTFRLSKPDNEDEPPAWALNLLQNMGRYVFGSGNIFRSGDYMDANGPICQGADTLLTALSFIADPQLPEIETPNGRVEFLQMIGITQEELLAMQVWNTLGVLSAISEHIPLYTTNLLRDSLLSLPAVSEAVRIGSETEGSNTGILYVDQLSWNSSPAGGISKTLTIGAKQAEVVGKLLRGRILKKRNLTLSGPETRIVFEPGEAREVQEQEDSVTFKLDPAAATAIAQLLTPVAGTFAVPAWPELIVSIVPTHIKDIEGNIVESIG
ncbi:suppressor of fused domain protein [Paenibacillus sp. IHBB 3054]|uniref:suppressor of fused domain protein n=1 Tax=Paenibacillus sp. IHBB 3054 TaxID=3425689 RepID=UPI003F664A88